MTLIAAPKSHVKPPQWNFSPALVEPRWRGLWARRPLFYLPIWTPSNVTGAVRDISGNGNHGTASSQSLQWAVRPRGLGFHSIGSVAARRIAVPDNWTLSGTDPVTVAIAFHRDSTEDGWFMSQGTEIVLREAGGSYEFILNSFSTNDRVSGGTPTTGYHTLVGRYDGSELSVWEDGIELGSVTPTGSYANDTSDFFVAGTDNASLNTQAIVYTASLWPYAWTASQIRDFHTDPFGPFRPARRRRVFVAAGGVTTLTAESGTFSLTGTDANLEHHRSLSAETSSFSLAGTDAGLEHHRVVTADSGTFSLTGTDANLEVHRVVSAESGTFALTGTDANLLEGHLINAESGTFTLAGTDATLTVAGDTTMVADPGTFTLTGTAADLLVGQVLSAESGAFDLTGTDVAFLRALALAAGAGTFALTGTDADLTTDVELTPAPRNALGPDSIHRHLGPDSGARHLGPDNNHRHLGPD